MDRLMRTMFPIATAVTAATVAMSLRPRPKRGESDARHPMARMEAVAEHDGVITARNAAPWSGLTKIIVWTDASDTLLREARRWTRAMEIRASIVRYQCSQM